LNFEFLGVFVLFLIPLFPSITFYTFLGYIIGWLFSISGVLLPSLWGSLLLRTRMVSLVPLIADNSSAFLCKFYYIRCVLSYVKRCLCIKCSKNLSNNGAMGGFRFLSLHLTWATILYICLFGKQFIGAQIFQRTFLEILLFPADSLIHSISLFPLY